MSYVDSAKTWLNAHDAPNWVPLALGVACALAILVTYFSTAAAEKFDNRNILVTSPSGALDRTLGQVDDRPGFGGVGAATAERFRGKAKRAGFLSTRGDGPEFWNVSTQLGNYFAGVDLSDDMSGVTDDAATLASGPADQAAAQAAASAAAGAVAAQGGNAQAQAAAAQAAAQEYFLKRPRAEFAKDGAKRNTQTVEDGLAARAHLGL